MYDLMLSYEELWKPVVTLIPELGIDSWVFFFLFDFISPSPISVKILRRDPFLIYNPQSSSSQRTYHGSAS